MKLASLSSENETFKRVAPGSKSIPRQIGRDEISVLRSNSSTGDGTEDVH